MRTPTALLAALCIAGCPIGPPDDPPSHRNYAERLGNAGLDDALLTRAWLSHAATALAEPMEIGLPHRESGVFLAHEPRALGLAFGAAGGQRLRLSFETAPDAVGRVFVQVLRDGDGGRDPREIAAIEPGASAPIALEDTGRYLIRIQPELLATVGYELRVELEAALPFPVSGLEPTAIGSFFGDPRDAGKRHHEGVDIFAPRMSPLVSVADGVAVARTNRLGGNTVWLRAGNRRYYYAHLERAAFEGRRRVAAGDVIGYVGNSGNARTTPTHLHFGIYESRRGSVDPLPYLRSKTFESAPASEDFEPMHVLTTATRLNLRAAPAVAADNVLASLPRGTAGRTLARSGQWLRLRTADGREGWIHGRYQRPAPADAAGR